MDESLKRPEASADNGAMSNSRRLTLKSLLAASVTTALIGAGAVPAAQAGPRVVKDTTDTTTETTVTKETKTTSTGRKVG